jgi:hypothetical protein
MSDHADPVDGPFQIAARVTFIVRLDASESEGATGIVEHASTGRKERFRGVEAISGVIAALMQGLAASQRDNPGRGSSARSKLTQKRKGRRSV